MYLWVVLATFIVAIVSFNLSVRPDMDRSYMETKARTAIARFKMQHNAFYSYIDSKRLRLNEQNTYDTPFVDYVSGVGYSNHEIKGTTSDNITLSGVESYFPRGYTPRADIYSKVFCFKQVSDGNNIEAEYRLTCENEGMDATCCSDTNVVVYVVSFEPISTNWLNKKGHPTSDMIAAITQTEGYGKTFGYNQEKKAESSSFEDENLPNYPVISGGFGYGINNTDDTYNLKYQRIFGAILDDEDYKTNCDEKTCLIAMNKVQNRENKAYTKACDPNDINCKTTPNAVIE